MSFPLAPLSNGLAMRVRPGDGDKILWIHGYTIDSSVWHDLWMLLSGWHHIGLDLPGHGASRAIEAGDDLPSLGQHIGRLAVEQNVRHLIALSFGTVIALQIAIAFPTAFASMILAAPALVGGPQDPDVERVYSTLAELYEQKGPGPHLRDLWMTSPPFLFKGAENQPELWRLLSDLVGRHGWQELQTKAMQQLTSHAQRESDLRRIQAATLILLGEEEMPAFRRCGEIIRRAVPHCQRLYLPDIGHLCMLEAPKLTSALIDAHLRAHAVKQPSHPLSNSSS